ncbi:MAG: prepilin-type N-terminal cleavage/methylation domain-containing protein [gamma proteobacterium symbiont of Bathyaustriella thionipta]|nr:prepilin-type N-terminal cleavage/methylation domain-containing protein [gamma proteobacterium symbiont of Bathyaustriella thionipta]MCU7949587.1 prepilin-type N-terminal cleavage/methylation domain-containing protein [gamma proteobacterium symbiont of Bathyaustriella thionipta]MCU7956179.1 prepilin-type N-terminal cleavage/methylation domain-containing protein [gamma proteobacterium symbiont of Bathyaustriella thionipta]MCU7967596.1 prepilin-type N-terminal cleavage/methylation domain-contai
MPVVKEKKQITFQYGFSMIEVLVALLILSIGLLATAAMQMGAGLLVIYKTTT